MIFQVVDDKKDCTGIFVDGKIEHRKLDEDLTGTWTYSDILQDCDVDYADLYCGGLSLDDACPEHLKDRLQTRTQKIQAFIRSFVTAKINLDEICFYDLVPSQHVAHYYNIKNEITDHVLSSYPRPKNYSFLRDTAITAKEIGDQKLKFNWEFLKPRYTKDMKARSLWDRFYNTDVRVHYNLFGTKTGRLGVKQGSFPILNLKKELRPFVIPTRDCFVELDYNAAEVRTLLSLSGELQPEGDIHEWNSINVFAAEKSRDDAKRSFLAWLYNPNSDAISTDSYNRTKVLQKYYSDGVVETPFGRNIESDDFHALNYLLQSCSSDNCITQVNKIHRFLRDKKTNVAFVIHDSIILDMSYDERHLLNQIVEIFEDTRLGKFPSGLSIGRNLGNLVRL
jgi:hypothetical protein